jgi:phage terminase large subunit-like protein
VWPKRELYDNLVTAVAKRDNAMMFSITTAGTDISGICYEQHEYLTKVLSGVLHDETYFGCIWATDEGDDPWDETSWRKANPNWGVSVNPTTFADHAQRAKQSPPAQAAFLTKHLGVWLQTD